MENAWGIFRPLDVYAHVLILLQIKGYFKMLRCPDKKGIWDHISLALFCGWRTWQVYNLSIITPFFFFTILIRKGLFSLEA